MVYVSCTLGELKDIVLEDASTYPGGTEEWYLADLKRYIGGKSLSRSGRRVKATNAYNCCYYFKSDPQVERRARRRARTVRDLMLDTLELHWSPHTKPSTYREIDRLVTRKIVPELGQVTLPELTSAVVSDWHRRVGKKSPGSANRALAALSKACSLAVRDQLMERNPCRGVTKFKEGKRERFLTPEEYRRLYDALAQFPGQEQVVAAIKLLALTGWRRGEAVRLEWRDVSFEHSSCYIRDGKTGSRHATIGAAALEHLASLERVGDYVFPGLHGGHIHPDSLNNVWATVRTEAKLEDVRIHDLRHSFASVLAKQGQSLPLIGALLGHKSPTTTARYAHLAAEDQRAAAASAAAAIAALDEV